MYNIMKKFDQPFVFHFTDKRNIDSIKKRGGLFSLAELRKSNSDEVYWGGNEWSHDADRLSGVDDYVHLCFTTNHPMAYVAAHEGRIQEIFWIRLNSDVLLLKGTMFTNDVANKAGVKPMKNNQAVKELDHEAIFRFIDFGVAGNQDRKIRAEKYEILIPKHVPIKYLENI